MRVQIYTKDGKVTSVRTNLPKGLTEEDIKNLLESYNESYKEDGMVCHLLDLDPLMSEVVKFFLGENEYKNQYEMSDIYEILEKTLGKVEGYQSDDGILEHKSAIATVKKLCEQKIVPKFEVGDIMRTLQEASDNITSGLPIIVSIDKEYYHCTNESIAIKDQDDYEYPPMNRTQNLT